MELDLRTAATRRVYVQVSEVALAQGHQMTQSAKVGLQILDLPPTTFDAEP